MNRLSLVILGIAAASIARLVFAAGSARAQQASDMNAIKAAHAAFYAALSARDVKAMAAVWARKSHVVVIGPVSKAAAVGYKNAVADYWPRVFARLPELSSAISSIAQTRTNGDMAWVIGTEHVVARTRSGKALNYSAFFTDILEKIGDRWLMVAHHAHRIAR